MRKVLAARVLALVLTCLLSMILLEPGLAEARPFIQSKNEVKEQELARNLARRPSRVDMVEAKRYGLFKHRLILCSLPDFVADNSDLFDPITSEINIRDVVKYWKLLYKQMVLRYGHDELERAIVRLPSRVRFDEVDRVFFELRDYILCLAATQD